MIGVMAMPGGTSPSTTQGVIRPGSALEDQICTWQWAGHQTGGEDVNTAGADALGSLLCISLDLTFQSVPGGLPAASNCISA